jgi:hypothetical protein
MHWLRRDDETTDSQAESLDPIRIFTHELELVGFVAPSGQRVTDMLLRGQDLAFLPEGADPAPDNWVSVSAADVLIVIPPPLPARSGWRPSRQTRQVFVRLGPYRVVGSAHLPPEVEHDGDMKARLPILPLTSASIVRDGDERSEEVEVAIANLAESVEHRILAESHA